MSALGFADRD